MMESTRAAALRTEVICLGNLGAETQNIVERVL